MNELTNYETYSLWMDPIHLHMNAMEMVVAKASLDYGEEVHWSVKNFKRKTRLFEATIGMVDKMEK